MSRSKLFTTLVFAILCCALGYFFPAVLYAVGEEPAKSCAEGLGLAYVGAALAVGLACIGSAYAVARIGSAAIGAVSEKPELMGRTLVFIGLAEGIAIYGLIIAIMILNKL